MMAAELARVPAQGRDDGDARRRNHQTLLDILVKHAEHGWVCPSLPKLAQITGINVSTVSEYLRRLRKDGLITSRLVSVKPHGQARIVTIIATGKSAATPQPSTRSKPDRPAFTPTEGGSPVRVIPRGSKEHREIERRLLDRDMAERRRGVA